MNDTLRGLRSDSKLENEPTQYRIAFLAENQPQAELEAKKRYIPVKAIVLVDSIEKAYGYLNIPFVRVSQLYDFDDPREYQKILSYAFEHGWKELK